MCCFYWSRGDSFYSTWWLLSRCTGTHYTLSSRSFFFLTLTWNLPLSLIAGRCATWLTWIESWFKLSDVISFFGSRPTGSLIPLDISGEIYNFSILLCLLVSSFEFALPTLFVVYNTLCNAVCEFAATLLLEVFKTSFAVSFSPIRFRAPLFWIRILDRLLSI